MNILDFNEVLESENEKNIILGNGFGIAYDHAFGESNFSWNTLSELCEIDTESPLYALIKDSNFDFELAHQKLNGACEVLAKYRDNDSLIEKYFGEIQSLREQLIIAVTKSHPASFATLEESRKDEVKKSVTNCRNFISKFDNVFSLNYDLLLYWVRCYEGDYLGVDSFSNINGDLLFSETDDANIFFPHGALFLTRHGISAEKTRNNNFCPILERTINKIRFGTFPMCISEGTGAQKKKAISNNEYLSFCYNMIMRSGGTFFTFGCSFMDGKDDHIIEAMLRSPAERIVVGEYNPTEETYHRLSHAFASVQNKQGARTPKKVQIADTSNVCVW